ncbi:MAG: AMP-binding protein [Melioribacteraceae bacterium]|nr:AMP-binding protein [Melioribacteraceae bacterium]MCF8354508.1 AMP-binding protein [Melioribacteraceae bacterium]MCF8394277.1 AMP-binding protein [Melioribacteraceae bacterium]MCF8418177.1 AMP-binding protein [Melioribacteraceae bacterium]
MSNYHLDWLAKWAKYTPNRMMLREYDSGLEWNYSDFNNRVNTLAVKFLNNYEINFGDRVAVYSKNRAEYVLLLFACIKTGAILVPLNFRLTPRELDALITDADPELFFYENDFEESVKQLKTFKNISQKNQIEEISSLLKEDIEETKFNLQPNINEETTVMILYTAGTTGLSKGAIINHRMLFWNSINTELRLDITSIDHTQSFAPFFHTGGWNVLFTPFVHHGASHTLLTKFEPGLILQLIEKEKATILFGVPTMLQMMADSEYFDKVDLNSVRYAIVGGAPMPLPLINKWHDKGVFIRQGYGLTEVGPNCFSLHQDDAIKKKGSIGYPNYYIEAKIMNELEQEVEVNEIGELWLKSPVVTPGYWRKEKETKRAITNGWFHTGDMVRKDEDDFYYVVDRKKNMYISGGENVYPSEIENYLYTNEAVREVAVIGVADEKWGEVGKAYVSLNENAALTEELLKEFCTGNLAKYKIPKYFEIINEIPKNDAGKIDKKKLLELHNKQSI